jgi:hypothetical protein
MKFKVSQPVVVRLLECGCIMGGKGLSTLGFERVRVNRVLINPNKKERKCY